MSRIERGPSVASSYPLLPPTRCEGYVSVGPPGVLGIIAFVRNCLHASVDAKPSLPARYLLDPESEI